MLKMLLRLCGRKPPGADGPIHPLRGLAGDAPLPTKIQTPEITSSMPRNSALSSVPSQVPEYIGTLKNGLVLLAKKTEPFLEGTPFKIPISVLNSFLDLAGAVSDNKSTLKAQLQQLTSTVDVINKAMDKATSQDTKERAWKLSEFLAAEMEEFEALQKRPRLAKILQSEEDTKTIDAALKRINSHLQIFQLDVMTSIERLGLEAVFEKLHRAAASDASHDAGERYPPPQCHPETRKDILAELDHWALEDDSRNRILWLHGPAGAGKSAVAQTLCQNLEADGHLGASFFFKRGHSSRGHAKKLFPTIAYHLANVLPAFKAALLAIMETEPAVFDKSPSIQLERLVIAPLQGIVLTRTMVIVLDGLDECEDEKAQQEIVELVGKAVVQFHFPLRCLIASRPESHISQAFGRPSFDGCLCELNIHKSFDDVRSYLRAECTRIHQEHETMLHVPAPWPSQTDVEYLVDKSSGYFVYAATVIKFIDDQDFRPTERLEIVMGIAEPENGSPFAALDQLYTQILEAVPGTRQLLRILSVLAAELILSLPHIEQLLGMKPGDVRLALRRAHSLIDVPPVSADGLTAHHASFLDFLNEETRSRAFYTGIDSPHHQGLAADIFKALAYTNEDRSLNAVGHVAWKVPLSFITRTQPSPDLFKFLRCINPDFIFRGTTFYSRPAKTVQVALEWLKEAQPSPPKDVVEVWQNYRYMSLCDVTWAHATEEATTNEEETRHLVSGTSPELVKIFHAYTCLYNVAHGQYPALWEIRHVLDLSWDELQTIICPLRVSVGDNQRELERLFRYVSRGRRIPELCSGKESLKDLATGAMQLMTKLSTHQLPREFYASAPFWGCVLRSCPPSSDLLRTVRETEAASALSDPRRPFNTGNVHNVIEWLKTFPDPPGDLITRIQNLLAVDKRRRTATGEGEGWDPEELWLEWKERTGW